MITEPKIHSQLQRTIYQDWWVLLAANAGLLTLGIIGLSRILAQKEAFVWGVTAGVILCYQLVHLRLHLKDNVPLVPGKVIFPDLGLANWLTMIRAALLALLAGFALISRPQGWGAWLPGILYMAAAIMDFFDGFAARVTGRSSRLGEILDMHWDGFGVLAACWLLVLYGQTPFWYLIIGLARYLFLAGMWFRDQKGWTNHPLPPSMIRRAVAGAQMGFIAVVLLPIFPPQITRVAAIIFAAPLLFGFGLDWMYVSGILAQPTKSYPTVGWQKDITPLFFRAFLMGLLVGAAAEQIQIGVSRPGVFWICIVGLAAISVGAAGRIAAISVAVMSGFVLRSDPGALIYWAVLLAGIMLFFIGTGKFSLWKPEDWLIYHRAGDKK